MEKIKIMPLSIAITALTYFWAFDTKFGTVVTGRPVGLEGVTFSVTFIAVLCFSKEYRKNYCTKKNICILLITFIINLPIAIICTRNQS